VASRPNFFGLGLGLGLKDLASASTLASNIWPRPSLNLCNRAFFWQKNRVKFGNFVNFSGNNLKSYVVNHYLVLFQNFLASASRSWPCSRLIVCVIIVKKFKTIRSGYTNVTQTDIQTDDLP